MKNFKKIISLTLSVFMVMSMMVTMVFADESTSVQIAPLYEEDFEDAVLYSSSATNDPYKWFDLDGRGKVIFGARNASTGTAWDGTTQYNLTAKKPEGGNGYLYIRGGYGDGLAIKKASLSEYLNDAVTQGANAYCVKFDLKVENPSDTGNSYFLWAVSTSDRNAIMFSNNKVYYKLHKNGSDPVVADGTEVAGVSTAGGQWVTAEYCWENGNSIWKINGQIVVQEKKYDTLISSIPDRQNKIYSPSTNAINVDNFEVKAYKWVPSPNSVYFSDDYQSYTVNTSGTSADTGVTAANANGVLTSGSGGSTTYDGKSSIRYSYIAKDDPTNSDNVYLKVVTNGAKSGSDSEAFTGFKNYIAECGAESFIIEFDYMLDKTPTSNMLIRYYPTNGALFALFFKEDKLYCRADGNTAAPSTPVDGITVSADTWYKISFSYNEGTLSAFFDNKLILEKSGFASAEDATYRFLHFPSEVSVTAVGIDNLKFRCYSDGIDTLETTFSESVSKGGTATVTATYENRLLPHLATYIAVYEGGKLVSVKKGVQATSSVIGAGNQSAQISVPSTTENYTVKCFIWDKNLIPYETYAPLTASAAVAD